MSRMSIASFLSSAKQSLSQIFRERRKASFVVGNESADLDSITSALVYGYLRSRSTGKLKDDMVIPVTNIPAADLHLRPELTALLRHADLKPSDLITLDDLDIGALQSTEWTLVDHNVLQGKLGQSVGRNITALIDHHEDEGQVPPDAKPRVIETSGSCNSLIVKHFRDVMQSDRLTSSSLSEDSTEDTLHNAQVAKLSLGAILIDTVNLRDKNKTTDYDVKAVEYLLKQIASSDQSFDPDAFYKEIDNAKTNLDELTIDDILRKDYKTWTEGKLSLGTAVSVQSISYLRHKPDALESALATFAKERALDLVCLMTAFTNEQDGFERELMLMAFGEGAAKHAADQFVKQCSETFQLEDLGGPAAEGVAVDVSFEHIWVQKNLAASRKQIAPRLREAMRAVQSGKQKM